MNKDDEARKAFKHNKNSVVSYILGASYAYYTFNESVLSDECFDGMCRWLHDNWDSVEHQHKHLFTKEDMKNGSLFMLKPKDYPSIVQNSVAQWIDEIRRQE